MSEYLVRAAIIAIAFAGTLLADYRYVTVDFPGQRSTLLRGINAAGQIVGEAGEPAGTSLVGLFTDIQGSIGLTFQYPGVTYTHTSGIDSAGNVVGQYLVSHGASGFVFLRSSAGAFTTLQPPVPLPPVLTFPNGQSISGNGVVVLSVSNNLGLFFRAADGSYTPILLPSDGSLSPTVSVRGIDHAGNVVGFYSPPARSFFRDAHGVFRTIQVPGAVFTEVEGMNNLGEVVGSYLDGTAWHGFLWRGGSDFTVIDYPRTKNTFASGINDSGVIVGYYDDANFRQHGMIAFPGAVSPVPAPPSLWLAITGCLALSGFWFLWRRRVA